MRPNKAWPTQDHKELKTEKKLKKHNQAPNDHNRHQQQKQDGVNTSNPTTQTKANLTPTKQLDLRKRYNAAKEA